ncbi:MAG: hypothetical protein AB1498_06550 [bacterium]
MKILFLGLGIFGLAFILQMVVWKVHLPKRHTKTILELFFSVFLVSFIFFSRLSLQGYEYIHIGFFYISLTLFYIMNYSAIEADSPSLLMLLEISKAGNKGVKKEEFLNNLPDDLLVISRIDALVLEKMAYIDKDKYYITKKGIIFVRVFVLYRRFLKLPEGG